MVNHDNGRTIKTIVQELDKAGYYVDYKVLNSINYGVPQMRERVYFVGIKKDVAKKGQKFNWAIPTMLPDIRNYLIDENNEISNSQLETLKRYMNNKYNKGKYTLENLLNEEYRVIDTRQSDLRIYQGKVPTLRKGRQGILYVKNGKLRNVTGYEGILLQGFDKEYADKVKGKVSDKNLLEQVGNAMTVCTIQAIGKSLMDYIDDTSTTVKLDWSELRKYAYEK